MAVLIHEKEALKKEVVACLSSAPEIRQIVVFGSFVHSDEPHDLDIAIFQETSETYLTLAMKYRRLLAPVAKKMALDVIPIRPEPAESGLLKAIRGGEVIYERHDI